MTTVTITRTSAGHDALMIPSSLHNVSSSTGTIPSRPHPGLLITQNHMIPPRPTHYLDDTDILMLRRQYENMNLLEQNHLSNSAEDLAQLENYAYSYDIFDQDPDEIDEDDVPFGNNNAYDYDIAIKERLKHANEEFHHDQTSSEARNSQRVSFDAVVKAVDIVQDPREHEYTDLLVPQLPPRIPELNDSRQSESVEDTAPRQYIVPLNDTQPRQGPSLIEQLKAMQFYGVQLNENIWPDTGHPVKDNNSSVASNENEEDVQNLTTSSVSSQKSMIVSINGRFDLQNVDDYTVKDQSCINGDGKKKKDKIFLPKPPSEPKQTQDGPRRPFTIRPKSSEVNKRPPLPPPKTSSENKTKSDPSNRQRPKSASTTSSTSSYINSPASGIDFVELMKKAAEKKRAELREERRRKEEAEEKRRIVLARAKESFERWMSEKNGERKRLIDEKRIEKEQTEARQAEDEKQLAELRRKKYKQWLERKNHEANVANEFRRLKLSEELFSAVSSTSSHNNHRAFHRWLRRKYEQALAEKRQARLEIKRQRRSHRRSIKRHQLHQDLQLAKTYGYS